MSGASRTCKDGQESLKDRNFNFDVDMTFEIDWMMGGDGHLCACQRSDHLINFSDGEREE